MSKLYSIIIRKGTIVGHVTNMGTYPVTLCGDVYVDASRHDDGCYGYCVGGACYVASVGTVEVI